MTITYIRKTVIPAALSMLPVKMTSPAAIAMLLAIGLQESRFKYRRQIGGPAHGFWQFEQAGGIAGVLAHHSTKHHIAEICAVLQYSPVPTPCYYAVVDNDILACAFARLLLWSSPKPLPLKTTPSEGWDFYLSAWRPGKPHRHTWDEHYKTAWEMV